MPQINCRIIEICVFKISRGQPEYLLLHRAEREKVYPGIWQLLSGTIEKNERTYDAALREFKEETRLKVRRFWVAPFVNSFYEPDYDAINLSPLFVVEVEGRSVPHLSSEHSEYGWFPYEQALEKLVWPGQRAGLKIAHECIVGGEKPAKLLELKLDFNAPPHE